MHAASHAANEKEGKCSDFTCNLKADKINLVYHTNQTKKMKRVKQKENRWAIKLMYMYILILFTMFSFEWSLSVSTCYLCGVFYLYIICKTRQEYKKTFKNVKNVTTIINVTTLFTSMIKAILYASATNMTMFAWPVYLAVFFKEVLLGY